MNASKFLTAFLLLSVATVGTARADHGYGYGHGYRGGGVGVGVVIGPGFGPWYYPAAPYYYPPSYPPVVIQQQAPVYVEQPAPAAGEPSNFWYYCTGAKAYYPYVKECPGGWQRVSPQPPG